MKRYPWLQYVGSVFHAKKGLIAALLIAVTGSAAISLIPPQLLRIILDQHLVLGVWEGLPVLSAGYLGVLLVIMVADVSREILLTILGQNITCALSNGMMQKLGKLETGFFTENEDGVILSRFTADVEAVSSLFQSGVFSMATDLFKVVGILFSIWMFSSGLGLLTLATIPIIMFITRYVQKRMLGAQVDNRRQISRVNGHISESLRNLRMIHAYAREDFMEKMYDKRLEENLKTIERVNFYDAVFSCVVQIIRSLIVAIIVLLACRGGTIGITAGMVAASIELITNLFTPIENLGMELQNIQKAVAGVTRIDDFFREPEYEPPREELTAEKVVPLGSGGEVSFEGLTFSYDGRHEVLRDLTAFIKKGERVTLIGRTGAGKSTLFRLILGILRPTSGHIRLNGIDVCDIPNHEKRKLFGYVEQSFHFLSGTIADQISMDDPSVAREQIERAVHLAGLDSLIKSSPQGLDTIVTGEGFFSQGQKQLFNIARAIVSDPPVLLLDEITSGLDAATEHQVISAIERAGENRTILSISHRLSGVIESDRVILLENGGIRAAGTPEELLAGDEWYRTQLALEQLTWN